MKGTLSMLQRLTGLVAFDTETALIPQAWKPRQVRLMQFHNDAMSFCLDVGDYDDAKWAVLREFFDRDDVELILHNARFDLRVLLANGVKPRNPVYCTLTASQILYNGHATMKHGLADCAKRECNLILDKELQARDWMKAELDTLGMAYAMADVEATWMLASVLHEKLAAQGLWDCYTLERNLIPAVVQMEHHGFYLDADVISECVEYYREQATQAKEYFVELLDSRLDAEGAPRLPRDEDGSFNLRPTATGRVKDGTKRPAGFNLNSSTQVLAYFKYLGIEPVNAEGKPSLDKKVLARFQSDELVRVLLSYKKAEKRAGMAGKLVEHRQEDGRIHANFSPLATGTGRFASSNINLQQVPRDTEFRSAFRPPAGRVLVQADYAAMELRVAAAVAGENAMLDAFALRADIHTRTAALMFGVEEWEVTKQKRQNAKALNFGALYGSGATGVHAFCATLGLFISLREAADLLHKWHAAYPAFGRWHRACQARADAGEPVRTRLGRRRRLFGQDNRLTTQANNEVQGISADCMKLALVHIYEELPPSAFLVATVHDEVIVECDEADGEAVLEIVTRNMREAGRTFLGDAVTLEAEGGVLRSWGEK